MVVNREYRASILPEPSLNLFAFRAVVVVDKEKATHRIPVLLRSYEYEGAEPALAPIWECARATSAAPT
jgi:hypothetical protein